MEQIEDVSEISRRSNDGLTVVLYWVKGTLATYVDVTDTKTGLDSFRIVTPEGVSPNEVFEHPFVYRGEKQDA